MFDGANHVPERPSHNKKRRVKSIACFLLDESDEVAKARCPQVHHASRSDAAFATASLLNALRTLRELRDFDQ